MRFRNLNEITQYISEFGLDRIDCWAYGLEINKKADSSKLKIKLKPTPVEVCKYDWNGSAYWSVKFKDPSKSVMSYFIEFALSEEEAFLNFYELIEEKILELEAVKEKTVERIDKNIERLRQLKQ